MAVGKEAEKVFERDGVGDVGGQEGAGVVHDKFVRPLQKCLDDLLICFRLYAAGSVDEDATFSEGDSSRLQQPQLQLR